MVSNNILRTLVLLILACLNSFLLNAGGLIDSTQSSRNLLIESYVRVGANRMRELMAQNAQNDLQGESQKNVYVIDFAEELQRENNPLAVAFFSNYTPTTSPYREVAEGAKPGILSHLNTVNGQLGTAKIYIGVNLFIPELLNVKTAASASGDGVDVTQSDKGTQIIVEKINDILTDIGSKVGGSPHVIAAWGRYIYTKNTVAGADKSVFQAFWLDRPSDNALYKTTFNRELTASQMNSRYGNQAVTSEQAVEKAKIYINGLADALQGKLTGKPFIDDCRSVNGAFYNKGGKDLDYGKVKAVSDVIASMMADNTYTEFIKTQIVAYAANKTLTNDDLDRLKQSLDYYKSAQVSALGGASDSNFRKLLSFLDQCRQQYQTDLANNRIVPGCLWQSSSTYPVPFTAGAIDAAWQTIIQGVDLLRFLNCWSLTSLLDAQCVQTRSQTIIVFGSIGELIDKQGAGGAITTIGTKIGQDIGTWYNQTACTTGPECFYNQGKLVFEIASSFVGIGEVKQGLKALNIGADVVETLKAVSTVVKSIKPLAGFKIIPKKTLSAAALYVTLGVGGQTLDIVRPLSKGIIEHTIQYADEATSAFTSAARNAVESLPETAFTKYVDEAVETAVQGVKNGVEGQVEKLGKQELYQAVAKINNQDHIILGTRVTDDFTKPFLKSEFRPILGMSLLGAVGAVSLRPKQAGNCQVCDNKPAAIKTLYASICQKAKSGTTSSVLYIESALNRMCQNMDQTNLESVGRVLNGNTFSNEYLREFLGDVYTDANCSNQTTNDYVSLKNNLSSLTPIMLDSWLIFRKSNCNCFRSSKAHLEELGRFLPSTVLTPNRTWQAETFVKLFKNYNTNGIINSTNSGLGAPITVDEELEEDDAPAKFVLVETSIPNAYMPAIKLLSCLRSLQQNNRPGLESVLDELVNAKNAYKLFVGAELQLREAVYNRGLATVAAFERQDQSPLGGRVIDISLTNGDRIETKSWRGFFRKSFIKQFSRDLEQATLVSQVKWVFDKKGDISSEDALRKFVESALTSEVGLEWLNRIQEGRKGAIFDLVEDEVVTPDRVVSFLNRNFNNIFTLRQ